MNDEQFRQLCNTYGFAPSRSLREMIDCATARAELAEREACAKLIELHGGDDRFGPPVTIERLAAAIRARKENT